MEGGGPRTKDLEMLHSSFFYEEHRLSEKIKSNKSRNFYPDCARRKTVIVFITLKKTQNSPVEDFLS